MNNPQLDLARSYVLDTGVSVFLTGKAGTGKTTFLHSIVNSTFKRFVVVAPTGVAAVNAGGVTIHSFFQLPFCPYLPEVKELVNEYQMPQYRNQLRKNKINIIRTLELLIVDEVSMVRADLLDAIDSVLRRYRRNSRPFGGVQLLLIGDVQQLAPVVTDEERPYMERVYPSPYFFNSKALRKLPYVTIELTTIYRQQDPLFVGLLNHIRDNQYDDDTLRRLNSRYVDKRLLDSTSTESPYADHIRLTTHNYQADRVNSARLKALPGREYHFDATVTGNFPESAYPTDMTLSIKVGTRVMFVKNDSRGSYYNGKIGVVSRIVSDEEIVVTDEQGCDIEVCPEKWENNVYEINPDDKQIVQRVDGTFLQFPLRLAWAVTIHKAQGLTFDRVIVDAAAAFSYGQVYVALSRCRTFEGLVLSSPITTNGAIASADVDTFVHSFPAEDGLRDNLVVNKVQHFFDQVFELFDFSALQHQVERLSRLYAEKLRSRHPVKADAMGRADADMQSWLSTVEKYHSQLRRLSLAGNTDDPYLHERIQKGAAYFLGKVEALNNQIVPSLNIVVTNKAVAADLSVLKSDYLDVATLKLRCLKAVADKGFTIDGYRRAKVDALLADEQKAPKRTAAKQQDKKGDSRVSESAKSALPEKKDETGKKPSWQQSAELFLAGLSLKEVASQRDMSPSTIESHLVTAYENDVVHVENLLPVDDLAVLAPYLADHKDAKLSDIYEHFDKQYSYIKIRVARLYVEKTKTTTDKGRGDFA